MTPENRFILGMRVDATSYAHATGQIVSLGQSRRKSLRVRGQCARGHGSLR